MEPQEGAQTAKEEGQNSQTSLSFASKRKGQLLEVGEISRRSRVDWVVRVPEPDKRESLSERESHESRSMARGANLQCMENGIQRWFWREWRT